MDIAQKKVLVVEDSEDMRAILHSELRDMGVGIVLEARDGHDAWDKLHEQDQHVDLVLCDWNMPVMTGIELLRNLRDEGSDVPFIMITGRGGGLDSFHEARYASATSFIQKPCSPARLEVEVRMAMQRYGAA